MLSRLPDMPGGEFGRWQKLIQKYSGIWIPEHRKTFLQTSLLRRIRAHKLEDYSSYYEKLQNGAWGSLEWFYLIDHLTVHETSFIRHGPSFDLVKRFSEARISDALQRQSDCKIQVWSVGCSTGEEAYSLALILENLDKQELVRAGLGFYYGVTGLDISLPALQQAREGIFEARKLSALAPRQVSDCFVKVSDSEYRIKDEFRKRTCFVRGNLKELRQAPRHNYDVIFCQNVLIYFQPQTRIKILDELVARLLPEGILVLGPGEVTDWKHPDLVRVDDKYCLAYQRRV